MTEWHPIPEFEGLYEASSDGDVRRCGEVAPAYKFAINGYWRVRFRSKGQRKAFLLHHVILRTFAGPRPPGYHGAHLDGDKRNNASANLQWVTPRENEAHKRLHGTDARGERSVHARFTDEQAAIIRELCGSGVVHTKLARLLGVTSQVIGSIALGHSYTEA